jgi:hypothetical protein
MNKYPFFSLFVFGLILNKTVQAKVIDVINQAGQTGLIQNAIDLAEDGDIIRVGPGHYQDNLNFGNKQITIESTAGAAKTIIKAKEKMKSVVVIKNGTLRGFSITGGVGSPRKSSYGNDYYGGGVSASGECTIESCAIYDNGKGTAGKNAGTFGGGVYVGGSSAKVMLRNSLLYDNNAWACGGAVLLDHGARMKIENCTIVANTSTAFFGHQGGVGMANGGQVEILNSILWGNSGNQIGSFSSIYAKGTLATVSHSSVEGGYSGQSNLVVTAADFINSGDATGPDGVFGNEDDGFRLSPTSIAIDQGNTNSIGDGNAVDLAGFLRVQGKQLDPGCYEFGGQKFESGRGAPELGAPGMVPGGFVNYIALLAEVRQEIVGAENELSVLLEAGRQQDKRVLELRTRLEELKKELVDLQAELKACKQKEERQREELTEVEQQVLSKELRLITVKGEVATLQRELDEAVCEEMKVEERIAHLKEEMEASAKKLKTAHTPGWHYAPGYGWLWTSPEHYPQIYSNARQGWVYYEQGTHEPWLYYDYGTEQWEEWFLDATLFLSIN